MEHDIRALLSTRDVRDIRVASQRLGNLPTRFNLSNLHKTITSLGDGLRNSIGTLGLTLGTNNVGLSLLLSLLDNKPGPLGILLSDLLLLNSLCEFFSESHMCNGNILQGNMELGGALHEIGADALRDGLTLGDEFGSIELGHNRFQDFVSDGREDTLVVVLAELLVNLGQVLHLGAVQHTQGQADHLQILGAGGGGDVARLGAHIKDDAALEPGDQEMRAFADDAFFDTGETVKDDGAGTAADVVEGFAEEGEADCGGDSEGVDAAEHAWGERHGGRRRWGGLKSSWLFDDIVAKVMVNQIIMQSKKYKSSKLAEGWSVLLESARPSGTLRQLDGSLD